MQICIIGAGAWGTALAIHFAQNGQQVCLWTRDAEHAAAMRAERINSGYLKDFPFPDRLAVADTPLPKPGLVIIATPTAGLRGSLQTLRQWGWGDIPVLTACKGFEQGSGLLPHQVAREELPDNPRIGILSGPSFAQELAQQLPCAVTLASDNTAWIESLATTLSSAVLRLYANDDMVGVGVGGAVKNVMAIAVGIADGLQYGLNARAALMTRGLAEINRLALALGAKQTTLMGLAGMGDLILTCTGSLSRNRQVGLKLAEGKPLPVILSELGHVAEGVYTIREAGAQAAKLGIEMPITRILNELLDGRVDVNDVAERLMLREIRSE